MPTLVERARAYLDVAQPEYKGRWIDEWVQAWLDAKGREAKGLTAAHQVDLTNSVITDEIKKMARERDAEHARYKLLVEQAMHLLGFSSAAIDAALVDPEFDASVLKLTYPGSPH